MSPTPFFAGHNITLQMHQSFLGCRLNRPATPLDFSHQHRALDRGDAKISHLLRISLFGQPSLSFFFEKETRNLALHHFKNQVQVLPDQFVVFGHLIPHRPERTSARHFIALLQFQLRQEPLLQVLPRVGLAEVKHNSGFRIASSFRVAQDLLGFGLAQKAFAHQGVN